MKRAVALALTSLLLAACEGSTHVTLKASGYSVSRYDSYAPLVLHDLHNPSSHDLTRVVIEARCREKPYQTLYTDFGPALVNIGAGATIDRVTLSYADGWPYFTGGPVSCRFETLNRNFPQEPNALLDFD